MRRCATVAFLAVLVLSTKVGAVEFGFDLGTRAEGLWPGGYYDFPRTVRGGVMDLLVNVPLSSATSVNFKVGGYESTNHGKTDAGSLSKVDLNGIDARVAFFVAAPIVKDAVSAYAGVGATYVYFRYSDTNRKVTENGITVGVPAGLRLRLSQRLSVCAEMEVPDVGFYRDAVLEESSGARWTLAWWQYGSVEPSVTAGLYLRY
jgi:hypothetical protein